MQFFIDTADTTQIAALLSYGMIDGVTTNPTLIAKSGRPMREVIGELCRLVPGPISAEVTATDTPTMLREAHYLADIASNVVIKLPMTWEGLEVCRSLSREGIATNVTLCFSAVQALLAAKAGATYVSPFVGRVDDIGQRGMQLIEEIVTIYQNYPDLKTKVLAASIRNPIHVHEAALAGAHVATLPPAIVKQLIHHPLTEKGLQLFAQDWASTGQSILPRT